MRNYRSIYLTVLSGLVFILPALSAQVNPLPYELSQPTASFPLPSALTEISGLSMAADGYHLLAVQDEDGRVYQLAPTDGSVVASWDFWKEGDYEGIEHCAGNTFVVKSTGTLYQIEALGTPAQQTIKYNDFLNSDNDVEGLACLPDQNKLLLACKASPGEMLDGEAVKAIYAFDLVSRTLQPEPVVLLHRTAIEAYLMHNQAGPNHEKICDIFSDEKEDFDLKIAALAVHPISGELYLTSAKGNLLLVVNMAGEIRSIHKLPKSLHRQPEGLCFDAQANLYIANEARGDDPPIIHRYAYDLNAAFKR
jgi:uncharacterized protein YjiK